MTRTPVAQTWLFLEKRSLGCQIGLFDDNRIRADFRLQRNRVASARSPDRLRIDGSRAIFADHAVFGLVETNRATNLTGVKNSSDFSVWFLIKPETDLDSILIGRKAMQVAVGNLPNGDDCLAIAECNRGSRRKRAYTLGINKFGSDQQAKHEGTGIDRSHPQTLASSTPGRLTPGRGGIDHFDWLPSLHFKKNHQRSQGNDGYKEKQVVADDGPNDRHFPL